MRRFAGFAKMSAVPRTVLIVDDHDTFRGAVRALLEADGFVVIGEAADGRQALAEVARLAPDIVLLDIQLPDLDGFSVAARLAATSPCPAVVLVSSRDAVTYGDRLLRAHAAGFLPKWEVTGATLAGILG
jgi:DNA-binding NarL/FixJ family response regulator